MVLTTKILNQEKMYLDAFSNIETFHINPLIITAAEL